MNLWLVVGAFVFIVLYPLSVRVIGRRLANSAWRVWNTEQTGPWAYFLFPLSSQLGHMGNTSRYHGFMMPLIVGIADSPEISLRGGHWSQEGRANYIATTAMVWPLKVISCGVCCIIVLAFTALFKVSKRGYHFASRMVYRLAGVA